MTRKSWRWLPMGMAMGLLMTWLLIVSVPTAQADGVVGNGTPASCTEAALKAAVANGGTITFNCGSNPHTITVTDDVEVTQDTVIDGGGSRQGGLITISGGQSTRVFLTANRVTFTIKNLTIKDGREPGSDGSGGGLYAGNFNTIVVRNSKFENNDGTSGNSERGGGAIAIKSVGSLTVIKSHFANNKGINGGAINNLLSDLTVLDSTFTNNDSTPGGASAGGYGAAIYTDGASGYTDDNIGGEIIIRDSVFTNNRGAGQGGAVFTFVYPPDKVIIERATFSENIVIKNSKGDALGAGLRHGNGELEIRDTIFAHNVARKQGGGFWTDGRHPATLTNVTFAHNQAVEDEATGEGGLGGAIAGGGNWTCVNCTMTKNHAGFVGGAIFGNKDVALQNTIIAHNTAYNSGNSWDISQNCAGEMIDKGNNLQFPEKSNPNDPNDHNCTKTITIADPSLGPLGDYGGTTQTVPLNSGSPAIDAGNNCPATDQRGVARPIGPACDIGAYEFGVGGLMLSRISPSLVGVSDPPGFTLSVTGFGFNENSVVRWNGDPQPTSFVSSSQLEASIPAAAVSSPAQVSITVYDADKDQETTPLTLTITAELAKIYLPTVFR